MANQPLKIVFLDAKTMGNIPNLDQLHKLGEVKIYQVTSPEQTAGRISGCQVVITNKVVINQQIIEQSPALRLICVAATGTNNVDIAFAEQKGIKVKNVVGYSTYSVAQHTFAMLLYVLEQLKYYDHYVQDGHYSKTDIFTNLDKEFWEINGKTLGIIGLGTIGKQVAKIAEAFGAKVIYYSTSGKNDNARYERVALDALLQLADVVSIHAPLTEHTRNLLNYEKIRLMKPTAILLNTGRGGIIHEADLARALDEELIAAAALDVVEKEPILPHNPLLHVTNKNKLLLTPHIAWASIESRTTLMDNVLKNIREFVESEQAN